MSLAWCAPIMGQAVTADFKTETVATTVPLVTYGGMGGVSVDGEGFVYVSNFGPEVWRVHPVSGDVKRLSEALYGASGNVVTSEGELLQAEFSAGRIRRFDRYGDMHTFSDEGLMGPVGLTVGSDGAIYVADCLAGHIARIEPEGGPAAAFASDERFACPNGITSAPDGTLYVVNNIDTRVFSIDPGGDVSMLAHLPGSGHGHVVHFDGALYITQLWNHEVVRLDMDGSVTTVSGDGRVGEVDGPVGVSKVKHPNGLAVSRGGSLYFNTIRGPMQLGERAELVLRRARIPTPFLRLRIGYQTGGVPGFAETFRGLEATGGDGSSVAQGGFVADMFLQEGDVDAGIDVHEWLADAFPRSADALTGLAQAHAHYGDPARAIAIYERVMAIEPSDDTRKRLEQLHRAR